MIGITEFAKRAGVSRNSIYKAIKSGRLQKSVKGKIDETDPLCVEYISGVNPTTQRQVTPKQSPQEPQITPQQSTSRAAIDAEKAKQQAIHWQLRNAKERGLLIDRELVAKAIEITDSEHRRILADGCQTMAKIACNLVKSGGSLEEVIDALRAEVSNSLKAWKRQISRQLKLFYDE